MGYDEPRMIAAEKRKVGEMGRAGQTSLLVRIPPVYARAVNLKKGSLVTLFFGHGDVLILAPDGAESQAVGALKGINSEDATAYRPPTAEVP